VKFFFVLLVAFSIIFITGFVSKAEEKSDIPELLIEVVNRCSTDVKSSEFVVEVTN